MGQLIQGPWKKKEEQVPAFDEVSTEKDYQDEYPWYALEAPKGTKSEQYRETLVKLKKLARVVRNAGGELMLPTGWRWNFQPFIDQLNRISESKEEEIPDEPA